jgi:ketosteroid isomerase-like protein
MNHKLTAFAVTVSLGAMTAACQKPAATANSAEPAGTAAAMVSDTDAAAAADATQAAWTSMDGAKIDAVYAPDVVGFDPVAAPLSTDRANWTKLQQGFAAMKFNHIDVADRKIQILDGNTFVVSGTATMTSTDGPVKSMPLRFTDVYHKQADDSWKIVNEHTSQVPKAAK